MIVFRNPGLIDLRCLRTFGVSVKPETDSPIGQFGSGAKAAAAILLRTGHKLTLYRGLDRHVFGVKRATIRGKDFDLVTMTGTNGVEEEMPFNTHVGEHWPDYAPFRELHSNALDEKGETVQLPKGPYRPRANETAFVVDGDGIERAYAMRDQIFLKGAPFLVGTDLDVHHGESKHVYYRGVRVFDLARPSLFTYNLTKLLWGLTEDRTLTNSSDFERNLARTLASATDKGFLEAVIAAPKEKCEYWLNNGWADDPTEAFLDVFASLRRGGRLLEISPLANSIYLRKHKVLPIPDTVELTAIQRKQLDKATAFCRRFGWDVTEYPILIVPHAQNGLLAWAQDKHIILTARVFDMGTKEVANALYEEHAHLKHGLRDESREFQTHIMREMMNLAEQIAGEPL